MSKNPLVSVIIPAYNAAAYIRESVGSIIQQTYKNIEILIIDDCSTDDTLSIVKQIERQDSRVRVVSNAENLGIGANRDKGIKLAGGAYVCWQDADDISMPDRIDLQVEFMESHPKVGIVGGHITFFDQEGDGLTRKYDENDAALRSKIFKYNPVAQPACMMRRECFEKVGGYNPHYRLSEDLEMQFRIGEQYEFGNVQQVVLKYRQTPGSLTAANLRQMELATLEIRKKYKNSTAYNFTLGDFLFNSAQRISMNMPYGLRMALFRLIRGDA